MPESRRDEYFLHSVAVVAARRAAGLGRPTQSPDDPWWAEGPHIEKDGRSYYVHAMGCLQSQLGEAMLNHPDWYLVGVHVRGRWVKVDGLEDHVISLGDLHEMSEALNPDQKRLAIELTSAEKRRRWGVSVEKRSTRGSGPG